MYNPKALQQISRQKIKTDDGELIKNWFKKRFILII